MQLFKVKYLKNGEPCGRSYTFKSPIEVHPGDIVQIDTSKKGMVVDEPVDSAWVITYGADKIKVILGILEEVSA
ncbi:hypothetical protein [uncultured Robinsoniella sp.]|uniref:hypothetical protein n=1 Tax=uncultured Robinsoniella sp. TaxID=904190 RepID=UPI00204ABCE3|nr:MAG TPA: hypothetical protein [Caudoviricetes sp.]